MITSTGYLVHMGRLEKGQFPLFHTHLTFIPFVIFCENTFDVVNDLGLIFVLNSNSVFFFFFNY